MKRRCNAASVGVDLVTDDSSDAVGSVSGERTGEGSSSGKVGRILHERLLNQKIIKIQQKGLLRTQEVGSW
jgi:hypothetical protein